jgi:hypothetical protein
MIRGLRPFTVLCNALCPLRYALCCFKAAIPSMKPFFNNKLYGTGLASFTAMRYALCALPFAASRPPSPQ